MPKIRAKPHKNKTANLREGHNINLGPLETIKDIEDGIRIQAKVLAAQGDHAASVQALRTLLSSKYRAAELELKGLNMRHEEGQEIKFTVNDYRKPYQDEVAKNKDLTERVSALEAQIAAMEGKERPRPPRPPMN